MEYLKFKTDEEIKNYLVSNSLTNTIYFVEPAYPFAIIGITFTNKLLYSYSEMVKTLYQDYMEQGLEDPYTSAMEWVDFNVGYYGSDSPIIVYDIPMDRLDGYCDANGVDDFFAGYKKWILGLDNQDNLLIDCNIPIDKSSNINEYIKTIDLNVQYV